MDLVLSFSVYQIITNTGNCPVKQFYAFFNQKNITERIVKVIVMYNFI